MPDCTCTYCGRKNRSGELCYDFTNIFLSVFKNDFRNDEAELKQLENVWKTTRMGPAMISEDDLKKWIPGRSIASGGRTRLRIPASEWLRRFDRWQRELTDHSVNYSGSSSNSIGASIRQRWANRSADPAPAGADEKAEFYHGEELWVKESPSTSAPADTEAEKITTITRIANRLKDASIIAQLNEWIVDTEIWFSKGEDIGALLTDGIMTPGGLMDTRYCPGCGHAVSWWAGRFEEILILVIGTSGAGKSSALASSADYYTSRRSDPNWGIHWSPSEKDRDWNAFKEAYLLPYQRNRATVSGPDAAAIPGISFLSKFPKSPYSFERKAVVTLVELRKGLTFPGTNRRFMEKRQRRLCETASCIWFCADQNTLNREDTKLYLSSVEKGFGVEHQLEIFRDYGDIFEGRDVPAALLLEKSDALPHAPDGVELFRTDYAPGEGWVTTDRIPLPYINNLYQYYRRALGVREYLADVNPEFLHEFERVFPKRTFLAVSNYGHSFDGDGASRSPYQTELPFLWLAAVKGMIMVQERNVRDFASPQNPKIMQNLTLSGRTYQHIGT